MRDAMVALQQRGFDSAALVHRHERSFRTLKDDFIASGHRFRVIRTGRWAHLLFTPISPLLPWHLRRLIKSFQPNILHLHLPNPAVFWVLALVSARRVPWVVHWHADVITAQQGGLMSLVYQLYKPFEQAVLKRSNSIVVTSRAYLDASVPLREFQAKCHVVPLGVDVKRLSGTADPVAGNSFEPDNSESASVTALQVLAVGRLSYYKGFRFLIEAAAMTPNIQIHIVGSGELDSELRKLAASLSLRDKVVFHGDLDRAELVQQITRCDCLCLPSIERTEAFGVVLLEAMYFGKATVISDLPGSGMGWIVDTGITGLKVKPTDAGSLAAAFVQLDNDREKLAIMGQAGKAKFDQQFEIKHAINGLVNVYEQALAGALPRADRV